MNPNRLVSTLFAALLLLGLGMGCKHDTSVRSTPPKKVVLERNVDLTTVQQKALVYRVETIGVLEAEGQTDIAAGVSGVVDEVLFREGDEVRAGDILAIIDRERYQADEELAKANVERAFQNLSVMRDIATRAERAGTALSPEDRARAVGNFRVAEAEHRSTVAAHARARNNLMRSRVKAPYDGRINKRLVTKGTYLEEKTPVATIADLSRLRLVGYVPESAAPVLRDMLAAQEYRLLGSRVGLMLAGVAAVHPVHQIAPFNVLMSDVVSSGYDPEFEVFALPGQTFLARIFYMSTVGNPDTHMFECKAEVLGWRLNSELAKEPSKKNGTDERKPTDPLPPLLPVEFQSPRPPAVKPLDVFSTPKLWPGFTAKIRFPLRSSPNAAVIPEEAIRHTEKGYVVFVPEERRREDGKSDWIARARLLDLGFRGDGWVEVRRGLAVGERLVVRGAEALEDGTPIRFSTK